jgi:CHAD domain-containing protein
VTGTIEVSQLSRAQAASPPAIFPDIRLRDYAVTELARAIACLSWSGGRLHAGVHQARKSIRRVRATLALDMPTLGPGADLIDRALRQANRHTSKLRDAQALVATLDALLEKTGAGDSSSMLRRARRAAAQARAARARIALADDPRWDDKRALLTTLLAALSALPWDRVTDADMRAALQRSLLRSDAAGGRARTSRRDADWHRWRRRARRLSQQQRALGDTTTARADASKRDKRLAVILGGVQDCALLREHLGKGSMFAQADRPALRVLAERRTRQLRERIAKMVADSTVKASG